MSFSSEQIIFLINPHSGKRNYKEIITALKKADSSIHYHISQSKNDTESFFDNLSKEYKVVVVCGGDGTINSILKHAVNTHLTFAILPNGSGNGFAREMGYTKSFNSLLADIKRGEIRKIDVANVNGDYCCNIAGIGFDSFIAHQFEKSGNRGLVTYVKETLKGFFRFPNLDATIIADDVRLEGNYFMLTMANTRQFGNNAIIAPNALPNDGLLDLVAVKSFSKIRTPLVLAKLLSRKGKDSKYIKYLKAREITIESDYQVYHIDGEPRTKDGTALTAKIETSINIIQTTKN